jgi:predicted HicB family RNase H-like nuclease
MRLDYKGYRGLATVEDGVLTVEIVGIDDLVMTACRDPSRVEATFAELVDDYIETCMTVGKEPNAA